VSDKNQITFFEILDREYIDYARLYKIHQSSAFFAVRAKDNLQFQRMFSNKVNKQNGVWLDQIGKLTGFHVSKKYPEKLRRIKFYDEERDNELLTNQNYKNVKELYGKQVKRVKLHLLNFSFKLNIRTYNSVNRNS